MARQMRRTTWEFGGEGTHIATHYHYPPPPQAAQPVALLPILHPPRTHQSAHGSRDTRELLLAAQLCNAIHITHACHSYIHMR